MPTRNDYSLRPIAEADLGKVLEWRNSERIRSNMYTDHFITLEEHRSWFDLLHKKKTDIYLVFELFQKPVGLTYFTNIDPKNGKCFWGFYLGEENLPRGTGTIMGTLGLEYAFEELHIRKLCGEAFRFNTASIGFFQRFGFVEEGHFVKHILKNGNYEDILFFALFCHEWQNKRANLARTVFAQEDGML